MFIAYSDASVKGYKASLAFIVVFEDKSIIRRRIVVKQTDSNIAEAFAFSELLSFLSYYKMTKGLILFDSNGLKIQLKKKGRQLYKHLPKDTKDTLKRLQIRTQVIPRNLNVAHNLSYEGKYKPSITVSAINRSFYSVVPDYPEYFMQLSVLGEYRDIHNKRLASFHEAQMKLNKKIWLGEIIEDIDDIKVYAIHDKRIKVYGDTIVKISRVNYVQIRHHWRMVRRRRKLKELLR